MRQAAATRRTWRRWLGAIGLSTGTAVFSGAVGILLDHLSAGGGLRWPYLAGSAVLGIGLSGGGAWLLATVKSAVGVMFAATEGGDPDRYQDEADNFGRYGRDVFTYQESVRLGVETENDLPLLRVRLRGALRTATSVEPRARAIGLLYQGRLHTGFHVGRWLNVAGRPVDLYSDSRGAGPSTHFAAIRLRPALSTAPRTMDILVKGAAGKAFNEAKPGSPDELPGLLGPVSGTRMGLAVNLIGAVGQTGFTEPVLRSARAEGLSVVVFAAPPAPEGNPDAIGRELQTRTEVYEGTVAAILAIAGRLPAFSGLLYLRGPAVISVALGRYLYGTGWVPMRHYSNRDDNPYELFADPSPP